MLYKHVGKCYGQWSAFIALWNCTAVCSDYQYVNLMWYIIIATQCQTKYQNLFMAFSEPTNEHGHWCTSDTIHRLLIIAFLSLIFFEVTARWSFTIILGVVVLHWTTQMKYNNSLPTVTRVLKFMLCVSAGYSMCSYH